MGCGEAGVTCFLNLLLISFTWLLCTFLFTLVVSVFVVFVFLCIVPLRVLVSLTLSFQLSLKTSEH